MPAIAPIGVRVDKYLDVPDSAKGPSVDQVKGYRTQKLGDGLYMITDGAYQSMFMALVVSGLLNKQVGGELGISEITVKAHRGQVMRKMKADSLPDLVTMAARLGMRSATRH